MSRIVLALGGNALGETLEEQHSAVKLTAKVIADLIQEGNEVVVTHGNGPQVGMIQQAMELLSQENPKISSVPLPTCVAMSQGYIGYDLQNALREELRNRHITSPVVCLLTQTVVDKEDPAFKNPQKPIGSFYTELEAKNKMQEGIPMMEDAGRGWRRVVPSPMPTDIVEADIVASLLLSKQVVIAAGGGGIPVIEVGNSLLPVDAVVDKDFASCVLAQKIDADYLVILTAVEKVAIHFRQPEEQWISSLTLEQARQYINQGEFAPGSMLPKVEAAVNFAASKPGRKSLITLLEKAQEGLEGKTGTLIQG